MTFNQVGLTVGLLFLFGFITIAFIEIIHDNIEQYRSNRCVVCKKLIDWSIVLEDFADIFEQVDYHGVECLTEDQQVVYEKRCCSYECYEELCTVIIEV